MFSPNNARFTLSEEGQERYGHIFPEGSVPLHTKDGIVEEAHFDDTDGTRRICKIDWAQLTDEQKAMICQAVRVNFPEQSQTEIRTYFTELGFVPIQMKYVIEAYDPRFFI